MRGKILCVIIALALVVAAIALTGCNGAGQDVISVTGTVTYVDLEGGFYGIVGDDGEHYDPINLSQEYQEDCLSIRFEAKIRDDIVNTHMWGTMVEITSIEPLGGS